MKTAAHWILANLLGAYLGSLFAHSTVARECERLGGFYVGTRIYQCDRVGKPPRVLPKGML